MKRETGRLVCLGCGFVATALACRLLDRGWSVAGTTRDAGRARRLASLGIEVIDPAPSRIAEAISENVYLLASAAPDGGGRPVSPFVGGNAGRRPDRDPPGRVPVFDIRLRGYRR